MSITIGSFYRFESRTTERLSVISEQIETVATSAKAHGLMILGREGVNCTFSCETPQFEELKKHMNELFQLKPTDWKVSFAKSHPFGFFQIKIRPEIVTLGNPKLVPDSENNHIEPSEFHRLLQNPETLILDTRNAYETDLGRFKNAIDPEMNEFREFPEYLKNSNLPKDKQILIYCTGGIRCEKAILEMKQQGYENVRQLKGGILRYLEEYPHQNFEGDCFVFDQRIAIDQNLKPASGYLWCDECGQARRENASCSSCLSA